MERRGVGHGFRCKGETGCIFIHLWGEGKGHSDGGVGCKWEKMVGRLAMVMRLDGVSWDRGSCDDAVIC